MPNILLLFVKTQLFASLYNLIDNFYSTHKVEQNFAFSWQRRQHSHYSSQRIFFNNIFFFFIGRLFPC